MGDGLNKDVFKQPEELVTENTSLPGFIPETVGEAKGRDLSEYVCRIYRGNIGGDSLEDQGMLENIMTRGLAGNGEVIIVDRATQSFEDNYWIVLTYLEKRTK